jgi:type VI secretion system protein ImpL
LLIEKLTGQTSPLLELFWFVSHNTDVGVPEVITPFMPVQAVEPPGPADKPAEHYIVDSNKGYILALSKLQADISPLASSPSDPALATVASSSAGAAKVTVTQVMGTQVDQKYHNENLVRALLEQPITHAEALLGGVGRAALNEAGKQFCSDFTQMTTKYPFNPNSSQDVGVDQLNEILAPKTGALWTFYDTKLSQLLTKQGSHYASVPGSVHLSGAFVDFFNRAAALSEALYPSGATSPKFAYTLKVMPSNLEGVVLKIGSETLAGTGQQKTFTWSGVSQDLHVTKGSEDLDPFAGPWSVFKFIADGRPPVSGRVSNLEWVSQTSGRTIMLPNGKTKSYTYQLEVPGLNLFRPGELSGMRCISQVAH